MKDLKPRPYFVLQYRELEELIKEFYGQEYEFVAKEELGNDSSKTFFVESDAPLDSWDAEDIEKFKKTGKIGNCRTHALLDDMAAQKFIPPGNYLIEVSW